MAFPDEEKPNPRVEIPFPDQEKQNAPEKTAFPGISATIRQTFEVLRKSKKITNRHIPEKNMYF